MRDFLMPVVARALEGVERLDLPQRADLYEGVGLLLEGKLPTEAAEALRTAAALREAEQAQLKFNLLVKEGGE